MDKIIRVGVDLAKNVMQIHAVDGVGRVVVRKAIARERFVSWFSNLEPCLSFRHLDPESIEILADSPNFDKKADLQRLSDNFTCRKTCNQLIDTPVLLHTFSASLIVAPAISSKRACTDPASLANDSRIPTRLRRNEKDEQPWRA